MSGTVCIAETLRVATYATELSRRGPGLLLRDILRDDEQVAAVVNIIAEAAPDILLLTGIDYDLGGVTVTALADRLRKVGVDYPYRLSLRPNTGEPTGYDLDGDGRSDRARDAQGYGLYVGQDGLALFSRFPFGAVRDHSGLLWRDLPGATLPQRDGEPFFPPEVTDVLRLSTTAHWDVAVLVHGARPVHVLAFDAGAPVFDGPEDRNGLRNADEVRFWQVLLDGALGPPPDRFVILGTGNLDPMDGEGRREAITALLADPRVTDPKPRSDGGVAAANPDQMGDPGLDTVDWWEDDGGPGNLRVDYVLPSSTLPVSDAGVVWSDPSRDPDSAAREALASRHRLVWVDIVTDGVP